jgi:hypothetical protein
MKPTVSLESPHAGRSRVGASNPTYTTLFLRNEDDRHYDSAREEGPLLVRGWPGHARLKALSRRP